MKEKILLKMMEYPNQTMHDICHFLKVYAFAQEIGKLEKLDDKTQKIVEYASIVHDIACPLCREKYGNTDGKHQEEESESLLKDFFASFDLDKDIVERIIFLVCHHHTYANIEGIDWQILVEADFLVNAEEAQYSRETIEVFKKNVFRTESGKHILELLYHV